MTARAFSYSDPGDGSRGLGVPLPPAWTERALCAEVGGDEWFPDKGQQGQVRAVKAVCRRCPVTAECLAYALTHNERYGVWGGLSERERRRLGRAS